MKSRSFFEGGILNNVLMRKHIKNALKTVLSRWFDVIMSFLKIYQSHTLI